MFWKAERIKLRLFSALILTGIPGIFLACMLLFLEHLVYKIDLLINLDPIKKEIHGVENFPFKSPNFKAIKNQRLHNPPIGEIGPFDPAFIFWKGIKCIQHGSQFVFKCSGLNFEALIGTVVPVNDGRGELDESRIRLPRFQTYKILSETKCSPLDLLFLLREEVLERFPFCVFRNLIKKLDMVLKSRTLSFPMITVQSYSFSLIKTIDAGS